jgi:hypothetical protein
MSLVTPTNIMGYENIFIVGRRLFVYSVKS